MTTKGFAGVEQVRSNVLRRRGEDAAACSSRQLPWSVHQPLTLRTLSSTGCPEGAPEALADAVGELSARVSGPVEGAICPHPGGPPVCWCRPPLPGLLLAFARTHGVDPVPLDAHRNEPSAQDAGDDPRRPLRPCLTGDRLELVHDLVERPPGVDLHRRPGP